MSSVRTVPGIQVSIQQMLLVATEQKPSIQNRKYNKNAMPDAIGLSNMWQKSLFALSMKCDLMLKTEDKMAQP